MSEAPVKQTPRKPDLVVRIYGAAGPGKTALMGRIARLVAEDGCEAVCLRGLSGQPKERICTPEPGEGQMEPLGVVKIVIVEQLD